MPPTESPLRRYARKVYSQNEDDGILEGIFKELGITQGYCVDVGAHDGLYLSNTANLIKHHGWGGLLIECSATRYAKLVENTRAFPGVTCASTLVALSGTETLDAQLERARAPARFELLSIDVDGIDYHIWDSLERFTPLVVIIEYNPSIPNHVRYVQPADGTINHGNALLSLIELGRSKGYEPVYVTDTNLIAVHSSVVGTLGITETAIEQLHDDRPFVTSLFQGFDGTLFLDGPKELFWQHVPIDVEKMQVLPKLLRRYQPSMPRPLRFVRAVWIAWYLARRREHWPLLRDKVIRGVTRTQPPPRSY